MTKKIQTPIVTCKDLTRKLNSLCKEAVGQNTDLTFKLNGKDLTVQDVRWNSFGDEVEILLMKGD